MAGSRVLLGCILLVVLGCANGGEVRPPKDPQIGVLTPEQAVVNMKRQPDYGCEGIEEIVMAWIDHYQPEEKLVQMYGGAVVPITIPHGKHTHYVFDRKTQRLTWWWVKQW
jgi:hypothetical protein